MLSCSEDARMLLRSGEHAMASCLPRFQGKAPASLNKLQAQQHLQRLAAKDACLATRPPLLWLRRSVSCPPSHGPPRDPTAAVCACAPLPAWVPWWRGRGQPRLRELRLENNLLVSFKV